MKNTRGRKIKYFSSSKFRRHLLRLALHCMHAGLGKNAHTIYLYMHIHCSAELAKPSVDNHTDYSHSRQNKGSNACYEQQGVLRAGSIPETGTRRQPPNRIPTTMPAAPTKRKCQVMSASLCTSPLLCICSVTAKQLAAIPTVSAACPMDSRQHVMNCRQIKTFVRQRQDQAHGIAFHPKACGMFDSEKTL